jgi:hypothetical protein
MNLMCELAGEGWGGGGVGGGGCSKHQSMDKQAARCIGHERRMDQART